MSRVSRKVLKNKDARNLVARLNSLFGADGPLPSNSRIEAFSIEGRTIYQAGGKDTFLEVGNRLIPSLTFERALRSLPWIKVDRGAVPHICSGADLMAPGVRGVTRPFNRGDLVLTVDETYQKGLAVGVALVGSQELHTLAKGKVVQILHYVGDKVWDFVKASSTTNL